MLSDSGQQKVLHSCAKWVRGQNPMSSDRPLLILFVTRMPKLSQNKTTYIYIYQCRSLIALLRGMLCPGWQWQHNNNSNVADKGLSAGWELRDLKTTQTHKKWRDAGLFLSYTQWPFPAQRMSSQTINFTPAHFRGRIWHSFHSALHSTYLPCIC